MLESISWNAVKPESLSAQELAYVGDAVYELYVRQYLISICESNVDDLHRRAIAFVSAQAQAEALRDIKHLLTEEEVGVWRRGRNAKGSVPRRTSVADYRCSTGLEALVGFLYLSRRWARLDEIMRAVVKAGEERLGGL